YHRDLPNHYHFTASTRGRFERVRIVAFALVEGPNERFEWREMELPVGWAGVEVRFPGAVVRASSQIDPDGDVILRLERLPEEGMRETFEVRSS
ncbi:hypothetical protein DRP77_09595, partial [Candidatus Poribacteria bacterium]